MVVRIELSRELLRKCWEIARARDAIKSPVNPKKISERPGADLHFEGLRAEAAVAQYLGRPELVNYSVETSGDGGTDLVLGGVRIQVKASTYLPPLLRFNSIGDFTADIAVLAYVPPPSDQGHLNWVELYGWIRRVDFILNCYPQDFGHGNRQVVGEEHLESLSTLASMSNQARENETMDDAETQSYPINELATALAKAQAVMGNAVMNRINPHFKSKYADIGSVLDAIRKPLSANGLSIVQPMQITEHGFVLRTILLHSSGQYIASEYPLPAAATPQALGSALTYARRYSLAAMVCNAADEDDDANEVNEASVIEDDGSRMRFIAECKATIAGTEGETLLKWWNSELQKQARRDFDLSAAEVSELMALVKARLGRTA